MTVHAISASVDPRLIAKVTRLFNQSEADIAAELLQNARRAGATKVIVTVMMYGADRAMLVVADNGRGIADPATLLRLGASGWDDDVVASEDPAGMGMFSLAGRAARITTRAAGSPGWAIAVEPGDWTSGRDIALQSCVRTPGTTISVEMSAGRIDDANCAIEKAAHYCPLDVELNGKPVLRRDFLDGAVHVTMFEGLNIGVFHAGDRCSPYNPAINFHGLTVQHKLPVVTEIGSPYNWYAKLDIIDCPALQLTLPARKEVVASPFLADLDAAVEAAIYTAIAARGSHRLSFADWCRAASLGIDLPPALAMLAPFVAGTADTALSDDYNSPTTVAGDLVMIDRFEPAEEQSLHRALAVSGNAIGSRLARSEHRLKGYDWYDALPAVETLRFIVKQGAAIHVDTLNEGVLNLADPSVDAIAAELTVIEDGIPQVYHLSSDMLLQPDENYDLEGASIAVVKGFACCVAALSPAILAEYLDRAYFCHSDDSDCDSFDTQLRAWRDDSIRIAAVVMEGEAAADRLALELAFDRHLKWLVPKGHRLTLSFAGDVLEIDIAIVPENVTAPA